MTPLCSWRLLAFCLWVLGWIAAAPGQDDVASSSSNPSLQHGSPEFNRDVRPLLSKHCFACHGPDEETREAGVRLDVDGEANLEDVVFRINSTDPDVVMPPPKFNKPLGESDRRLLEAWIAEGGRYQDHWSFVLPRKTPVPERVHPIDYFVDRRLAQEGRSRSSRTDPLTLVRRLHLDLIGLLPNQDVAERFAADPSQQAYVQMVDELLQSPRYGERWARRWLDLARYADTNGYEKDRDRTIWPYRDWVIDALNNDMPFDQFTVEQLAGDMLPDATAQQLIATGFHRNTMLNEEGGIDPLEFRFHAMTDRVATTGTTWLGLTTGCAQCHTHKYDPITHHDYYGMMAYLNNADEPKYFLPDDQARQQRERNLAEADRLVAELASHWPTQETIDAETARLQAAENSKAEKENRKPKVIAPSAKPIALETALQAWIKAQSDSAVDWVALEPNQLDANVPFLELEEDGIVMAAGDTSKHDIYTLAFPASKTPIHALRLEALPDERLPGRGPGMTYYEGSEGDFFLTEIEIHVDDSMSFSISDASDTRSKNRFGKGAATAEQACDGDIQTGWSVAGEGAGKRSVSVFRLREPIPSGTPFTLRMHFGRHYASSLGKFRWSATSSDSPVQAVAYSSEIAQVLRGDDPAEHAGVREAFLMQAPELKAHVEKIERLRSSWPGPTTLVMRERPPENIRPTFVHHRGEYTQPADQVQPRLPEVLLFDESGKRTDSMPSDRLSFARWLVSRNNPLTARVVVNRHWAAFFGTGIVSTVDDFGMQGESPSHPALLDHLAVEFMQQGWSIKQLHRLIVTSQTYQQSSSLTPEQAAAGPDRLLGRFPRKRLEAEIIRDAALQVAGLLSDKMHGPPVRPPQPESARGADYSKSKWTASKGEDRYRRSVYTYQKRTAPFAMFTTFDAGSGESCIARRDVSNTPLQALTLMNDPMFVEIAKAFGDQMKDGSGTTRQKLSRGFQRLLTRSPRDHELDLLIPFYEKHSSWTAVARVLLCLDEAITKN